MSESKDQVQTSEFIAKLFGITTRNVRQLAEKGVLHKIEDNKYPLVRNIKSYIAYLRNRKEFQQGTPLAEQKLRLTTANAEKIEIQNQIAKGKIVPIELLTTILSEVSGQIAGSLDTIPAKIKRKHPQIDNQLIEAIKFQIVKAMNSISDIDDIVDRVIDEYISDNTEFTED